MIHYLLDICWKIGHKKDEAYSFPEGPLQRGIIKANFFCNIFPRNFEIPEKVAASQNFQVLIEIQCGRKLTVGIRK